jgi:hypothetical protein
LLYPPAHLAVDRAGLSTPVETPFRPHALRAPALLRVLLSAAAVRRFALQRRRPVVSRVPQRKAGRHRHDDRASIQSALAVKLNSRDRVVEFARLVAGAAARRLVREHNKVHSMSKPPQPERKSHGHIAVPNLEEPAALRVDPASSFKRFHPLRRAAGPPQLGVTS